MVDFNPRSTLSLSSLLCLETETFLNNEQEEEVEEEEEEIIGFTSGSRGDVYDDDDDDDDDDEEEEYLKIMFVREMKSVESEAAESSVSNWIKRARLDSIQWTLNTRALLGFRFHTTYLSITYFDRFLSRRLIHDEKPWAVRLLSVACLSLAAKMEECKVPALTEFQVEDYNFGSTMIQRMELLVLNTLEWKMVSVTPFAYLHYFISKLCQESLERNVVSAGTIELIFAIAQDMSLMHHRSSSIATAATLLAMDRQLTRLSLEIKMNALSLNRFIDMEDVYSCYSTMLEKTKFTRSINSPDFSPGEHADVFKNLGFVSAVGTKRKRLIFSDCDQDSSLLKEKQHHRHC